MGYLQTDTDLRGMFQEDFLVGHYNKTCRIMFVIINIVCKHLKAVNLCRVHAAHCRLGRILILYHLLCRDRSICHIDSLPAAVGIQKMCCLHKRHTFGIHSLNVFKRSARKPGQCMANRNHRFTHNIIFKFNQQIIHLVHRTCCGIFDWKNSKICRAILNGFHRLTESSHIEAVAVFTEITLHCRFAVSSFCSGKYNSCLISVQ